MTFQKKEPPSRKKKKKKTVHTQKKKSVFGSHFSHIFIAQPFCPCLVYLQLFHNICRFFTKKSHLQIFIIFNMIVEHHPTNVLLLEKKSATSFLNLKKKKG